MKPSRRPSACQVEFLPQSAQRMGLKSALLLNRVAFWVFTCFQYSNFLLTWAITASLCLLPGLLWLAAPANAPPRSCTGSTCMAQTQIGASAWLITCHFDCYILRGISPVAFPSLLVFSWVREKWSDVADRAAAGLWPCTGHNKYNHFLIFSSVIGFRAVLHFLYPLMFPVWLWYRTRSYNATVSVQWDLWPKKM